jgi:hypothetical protein
MSIATFRHQPLSSYLVSLVSWVSASYWPHLFWRGLGPAHKLDRKIKECCITESHFSLSNESLCYFPIMLLHSSFKSMKVECEILIMNARDDNNSLPSDTNTDQHLSSADSSFQYSICTKLPTLLLSTSIPGIKVTLLRHQALCQPSDHLLSNINWSDIRFNNGAKATSICLGSQPQG